MIISAHQPSEREQLLLDILEVLHDDLAIISKDGIFETVFSNFQAIYGIPAGEVVGQSIYDMEEQKVFNPSAAARVMKSGRPETILQLSGSGQYLMCTAIPLFDREGELLKIVSFTRDVTQYETIKSEYGKLQDMVSIYTTEIEQLRQEQNAPSDIISESEEAKKMLTLINRIAKFDSNVFITGESGVGKTMYAKYIHAQSPRRAGPFIEINCGAIPENLLESELFGYERGAFTGANREGKPGLIELTDGGTLFLDEIGDMPLHMQAKLLTVIQDRKLTRVGGTTSRPVNFRLISATNRRIDEMVAAGDFREDLYYRMNVISIDIPPLRERKDDVFHLIVHFTKKYCQKYGINCAMSSAVIDKLVDYNWPGNIRELENVVERMVVTSENYVIHKEDLPAAVTKKRAVLDYDPNTNKATLREMIESVEKKIFTEYFQKYGSTTKVAEALGISQPSASQKINKYVKRN